MYDFFSKIQTPEEIAQFRAATERQLSDANILNNRLSTTTNMTKNLSPMANLGIMLGTLGGMWGANRYNDILQNKIEGMKLGNTGGENTAPMTSLLLGARQYTNWRQPADLLNLNVQSDFYKPFLANTGRSFFAPYQPNL